jgi:hypothetical protein
MQRFTSILMLFACLSFMHVSPAAAWLFGDDTLVTIDGNNYSAEEFKHWWKFWKEEETPLPETPDAYIDWLLLSKEAQRMDIPNAPAFKRQTRIFLQSRTLLMLKYDAVDSQIKITDAEIESRYDEQFSPRWLVQRFEFKDEKAALDALQRLTDGSETVETLVEHDAEQGGAVDVIENWMRPKNIDAGWTAILSKIEVGEMVDPAEHAKGRVLYRLKDRKGKDAEDFELFRESIRKELWKEKEDELTQALLDELKVKYDVKVDKERIAALDINAADETLSDAPVITTNRENVSEKEFIAVIRRLMKSRPTAAHAASDPDLASDLKNESVINIIAQSLTNWESIDRHYEEKEPFKWVYDFNYNHRLGLMVEEQLFLPKAEVTDEEVRQYFEENISRYTQPQIVKLYIVDETQGPIDKIWAEVAVGKKFKKALEQYFEQAVHPQEVPANHLDPEVKAVVEKLVAGETSQIFNAQGIRVMVHLTERTAEAPLSFDRVKGSIRSQLKREKLDQVRSEYLEKLRANSEIEVRNRQWKAIQKELGGA